jgi:hypothetical protein
MRRSYYLACALVGAASFTLPAIGNQAKLPSDDQADPFQANTVWRGECLYEKSDYFPESKPFPMILYVNRRSGADFEAVTWYPTYGNGLLAVKGQVSAKGTVTFLEDKAIHGQATAGGKHPNGVVPGMKFTGKMDKTTITGSGDWTGPAFNGPIRTRFTLRLAK